MTKQTARAPGAINPAAAPHRPRTVTGNTSHAAPTSGTCAACLQLG